MEEILEYMKTGFYPGSCGMEFAAAVDDVRLKLKQTKRRPNNVDDLLQFIKENYGRCYQDPRTPACIIAKMVNLECMSFDADGKITYHENKLGLNR